MTKDASPSKTQRLNLSALSAVLLGVVIVTLDISLTSTAIPAIARGIGASAASTIWIINIYYLAVVAALLPLALALKGLAQSAPVVAGLISGSPRSCRDIVRTLQSIICSESAHS